MTLMVLNDAEAMETDLVFDANGHSKEEIEEVIRKAKKTYEEDEYADDLFTYVRAEIENLGCKLFEYEQVYY